MANGTYETVKIERDTGENAGLTWVILNRPEKRNAMSPQLHFDMANVLDELESDAQTRLIVLTGAGEACAARPRRSRARPKCASTEPNCQCASLGSTPLRGSPGILPATHLAR